MVHPCPYLSECTGKDITIDRNVHGRTLQLRGMYRGQILQLGGMYRGQTLQVRGIYSKWTIHLRGMYSDIHYKLTLRQNRVHVYTEPVYCTIVH